LLLLLFVAHCNAFPPKVGIGFCMTSVVCRACGSGQWQPCSSL
jgi:hypothetical protein